jgi:hypothetical protein
MNEVAKILKGGSRDVIEALPSCFLPAGNEKNHEMLQSGQ